MRTALVALVRGGGLSSAGAGGLETVGMNLLPPPWSLPLSGGKGLGVEGQAPSPRVRRLRGDFHVWRSQILCFREVTYQGQCWFSS